MRYSSRLIHRGSVSRKTDRFYHLFITQDLFGAYLLVKEYGEIGRSGIVQKTGFQSKKDAFKALLVCEQRMLKRGYNMP